MIFFSCAVHHKRQCISTNQIESQRAHFISLCIRPTIPKYFYKIYQFASANVPVQKNTIYQLISAHAINTVARITSLFWELQISISDFSDPFLVFHYLLIIAKLWICKHKFWRISCPPMKNKKLSCPMSVPA